LLSAGTRVGQQLPMTTGPTPRATNPAERAPAGGTPAGGRTVSLGLPIGLSVVVHAALAALLATVAWRLASPPEAPPASPAEAFIAALPSSPPQFPEVDPPTVPVSDPPPSEPPVGTPTRVHTESPRPTGTNAPGSATPAPTAAPSPPSGISSALAPSQTPGPGVRFGGLSVSRAASVVFVLDGSAPQLSALPMVKASLRSTVAALIPAQQFSVIVFQDTAYDPAEPNSVRHLAFSERPVDATPRNLARLTDWLAPIEARGRSNPLDGLRAALAMRPRPQVVFLLSRSIARSHGGQWEGGLPAILKHLDDLNPPDPATGRRPTTIKTLQFLEPDPTGTMQAIARIHGTNGPSANAQPTSAPSLDYRVVTLEELQK